MIVSVLPIEWCQRGFHIEKSGRLEAFRMSKRIQFNRGCVTLVTPVKSR